MRPKRILALLVASALPVVSAPASAAIVTSLDDGFEADTPSFNQTVFNNWTVTDGAVDLVGTPNGFGGVCGGGLNCVDLNGTTGAEGTIQTTDTFADGIYNVAFDLSGSQRGDGFNDVRVTFGDLDTTISLDDDAPWATHFFTVTLSGGAQDFLQFASLNAGTDNIGLLLDNIAVTLVPIPAAFWLFGSGLLGMFGLSRRRKAAQA